MISLEQYASAFDRIPVSLMVLDGEDRIVWWNRASGELTGYALGEVAGGHLHDFGLGPEGDWRTKSGDRRRIEWIGTPAEPGEEAGHVIGIAVDLTGVRRDGDPEELRTAITDAVGPLLAAMVRDVAERKRMEEAHRALEAKFVGIVTTAAEAIVSIDGHQRITMFNNGAEQIFGYSSTEALGAPLDLLIPELLHTAHREHVRVFAAGQTAWRRMGARGAAILGRRKNGETFPAEAAISRFGVGDQARLTVVLRDVTEQTLAATDQRALSEIGAILGSSLDYEERLTRVADLCVKFHSDCSIVEIVDEDGHVRRLRVAVADPAQEAVADRLRDVPIDREKPFLAWKAMQTRQPTLLPDISPDALLDFTQEGEHRKFVRELAPRSILAVPLIARERLLGAIVFLSCRPGRRYGARDLWLAEEIARRAALAIDNAHLYRASHRATQARDQMLGVVAHDLRSPLNTILLTASSILRRPRLDPAGVRDGLERIVRSVERTNRLVQDLLDVDAIESGRLTVNRSAQSPARLVAEAIDMVRLAPSIELAVRVPELLPKVGADRDRILAVFSNLLGNAIHFTRRGRITVGAVQMGGEVRFHVADTGVGIAREDLQHVFDRFWQASKGRQGYGLGLAICKGIVEAHGGRIWAESEQGVGTTFFFTLPAISTIDDQPSAES